MLIIAIIGTNSSSAKNININEYNIDINNVAINPITIVTIFIIKSFGILESIIPNSKFESYLNSDSQFLYFGIAPVIMGLFSIFIKKKGFFVVLLNLLLSLALFLIMFIFM